MNPVGVTCINNFYGRDYKFLVHLEKVGKSNLLNVSSLCTFTSCSHLTGFSKAPSYVAALILIVPE